MEVAENQQAASGAVRANEWGGTGGILVNGAERWGMET